MSTPVDFSSLKEELASFCEENKIKINDNFSSAKDQFGANCEFTNSRNTNMSLTIYFTDNREKKLNNQLPPKSCDFNLIVKKNDGSKRIIKNLKCNEEQIKDNLNEAKKIALSMITNRVQILNLTSEAPDLSKREYKKGYPVLFENETLSDFQKNHPAPAGIVINSNDKFQPFTTSYNFTKGEREIHYETKEYKTPKGAQKFLESKGFDSEGLVIAKEFTEEFYNLRLRDIAPYTSTSFSPSTLETHFAFGEFNSDSVDLSPIITVQDPEFGARYHMDFTYTDDATGKVYQESIPLHGNSCDDPYRNTFFHIKSVVEKLKAGELEYDEDARTPSQRRQFHIERVKSLSSILANNEKRIIDAGKEKGSIYYNEHYHNNLIESSKKLEDMIEKHKEACKEISKENDLSLTK